MTPREELASLLSDARKAAGYSSQAKLAKALHVSRPVASKAESATQPLPSAAVIKGYVGIGADETEIKRLIEAMTSGSPEWFMPYLGPEAQAVVLRSWNPFLVPGLLQTENYMRTLFLADEPYPASRLAGLIKGRLERQSAIGRAYLTAILDHQVLYRLIGSPAIMAEQCRHLVAMAERPDVALYVIPEGTNTALWGAMSLATSKEGKTTVCFTTMEDIPTTAADMVSKAQQTFERLLGAALPRIESHDHIVEAQETWETRI
jgi:hypothetical protein